MLARIPEIQSNVQENHYKEAWSETNKNGRRPRVGMENAQTYFVSDDQLYNGAFFKIKQLQIGYTLPKDLMRKLSIENLRIYASCENVFTITNYPGFDPEIMDSANINTTTGTSGSAIGIDSGRYPNNRNFILGLNLTF